MQGGPCPFFTHKDCEIAQRCPFRTFCILEERRRAFNCAEKERTLIRQSGGQARSARAAPVSRPGMRGNRHQVWPVFVRSEGLFGKNIPAGFSHPSVLDNYGPCLDTHSEIAKAIGDRFPLYFFRLRL